jgi:hypothetical protein
MLRKVATFEEEKMNKLILYTTTADPIVEVFEGSDPVDTFWEKYIEENKPQIIVCEKGDAPVSLIGFYPGEKMLTYDAYRRAGMWLFEKKEEGYWGFLPISCTFVVRNENVGEFSQLLLELIKDESNLTTRRSALKHLLGGGND